MKGYKVFEQPFAPTESDQLHAKENGLTCVSVFLEVPEGAAIRRINARFLQREKMVVHPQTKEMTKALIHEEVVYVWYEADPMKPKTKRQFYIVSVGGDVPEDGTYFTTLLLQAGAVVFNIYEKVP